MRFSVLASGSKGNACYIETSKTRLLIDAGLSCRETLKRLELVGIHLETLDAIILTHEHSDHVKGVGPVSRKFNSTVYANFFTIEKCRKVLGKIQEIGELHTDSPLTINDITIETFSKPHDAIDPVGMIVSSNGSRLGILTDLGISTPVLEEQLKECTGLLLEFNHDVEMLEQGPYPYYLKKRIRGVNGHLSNDQAGILLKKLSHENLKHVILGHLSEVNNSPEKALSKAKESLAKCDRGNIPVHVSYPDYPCPLLEV